MKRVIALALIFAAGPVLAGVIEGRVIEVPDGGTITVLTREGASMHRVRLAGIDAPGRDRTYGSNSRESLRRLTVGKTVRVETAGLDAKGLLIGVVLVVRSAIECGNQPCAPVLDPGLSQLSFGWAVIDQSNLARQSDAAQKQYAVAEGQARTSRLGLWREPSFQLRTEVVQTR
jgi:endonuclease YncB( thermonuclease family)